MLLFSFYPKPFHSYLIWPWFSTIKHIYGIIVRLKTSSKSYQDTTIISKSHFDLTKYLYKSKILLSESIRYCIAQIPVCQIIGGQAKAKHVIAKSILHKQKIINNGFISLLVDALTSIPFIVMYPITLL